MISFRVSHQVQHPLHSVGVRLAAAVARDRSMPPVRRRYAGKQPSRDHIMPPTPSETSHLVQECQWTSPSPCNTAASSWPRSIALASLIIAAEVARDSLRMFWPDGRRASAHCSFVHAFRQWAEVLGHSGSVTLDDFVLPKSAHQVAGLRIIHIMYYIYACVHVCAVMSVPRHHRSARAHACTRQHSLSSRTLASSPCERQPPPVQLSKCS
jgi:hypothetical protein